MKERIIEWKFRHFCEKNNTTTMCIINNGNGETVIELNAKGSLLEELKR